MGLSISTEVLVLPLKKPFRITHGTFPERKSLIIKLTDEDLTGYGEVSEITYYDWDIDNYQALIGENKKKLEEIIIEDPRSIRPYLESIFPDTQPLLSGIDCALWDLYTQKENQPLWKFLQLNPSDAPLSSYTISLNKPEIMINEILQCDWPIIKIKLGDIEDIDFLHLLIDRGIDKKLRIDANEGWALPQFTEIIRLLNQLNIELIEQPLPVNAVEGMNEIQAECSIPLIADESCHTTEDVEKCADLFDGINIKLMKCGGICPALEMIDLARKSDLQVMGGCMTETAIGISALCQLAPMMDYIDADGAELLAVEPAHGVKVRKGEIHYPATSGLGARLD